MKTKILYSLLAGCLLAVAAWFVRAPTPAQADDIPEKYQVTVTKGLRYLIGNQCKDGHWEGDKGQHPVAMTGLVGLALLMETYIPPDNPFDRKLPPPASHSDNIRKAADWLVSKSRPGRDGLIFSEHPSETDRYMQGHGLATLFLAGAFRCEVDEKRRAKLGDVITQAVKYIVKAQSSQGGWYRTSKVEGHDFDSISDTVIQIQALQAAENAGIPFSHQIIRDAHEYLKESLEKAEDDAKARQNVSRAIETASVLSTRTGPGLFVGDEQNELSSIWLKLCQTTIPVGNAMQFGRDELTNYYYSQAVFNFGGEAWTTYRTAMFDQLQKTQNQDGSWPTSDGISVGQVYSTALWCTVLQLDKGAHPSRAPQPVTFSTR